MSIGPCMCGATDCPSCGPAQGYQVVRVWDAERRRFVWVNPEPDEVAVEEYLLKHLDEMHDDVDVAPFVRRTVDIMSQKLETQARNNALAGVMLELLDAYIEAARRGVERDQPEPDCGGD